MPDTDYRLCINASSSANCKFKDKSGNLLSKIEWKFRTSQLNQSLSNEKIVKDVPSKKVDKNIVITKCKDAAQLITNKGYEHAKEIFTQTDGCNPI